MAAIRLLLTQTSSKKQISQSKHQKHEAFEAELDANDDRVNSVINNGRQLIDNHQCAGSEDAVQVVTQMSMS